MRIAILFVCFLVEWSSAVSQNGYSVTYHSVEDKYLPITLNGEKRLLPRITERLVFDDSMSFCYRIMPTIKDPLKKANIFGEKLVHHALIYNLSTHLSYSEVAWPKGKKKYLITGELKKEKWHEPCYHNCQIFFQMQVFFLPVLLIT